MPGTFLNLVLPTGSDNMATVVSKTATALSAIQTDLTPRITAGQLSISGTLECGGALVNGVGGMTFVNGASVATTAPSLFFSGGELYALTTAGAVKVTNAGVVNVAGSGGIGGDYPGHSGALVSLVYATNTYHFVSDPGAYSNLEFQSAILKYAGGTVTVGVDAAMAPATASFNFKSLPTSGISLMAFDAATSGFQKAEAATITNAVVINDLKVATNFRFTEAWQKVLSGWVATVGASSIGPFSWGQTTGAAATAVAMTALRTGDRISAATVSLHKTTGGTATVKLYKYQMVPSTSTLVQTATTTFSGDVTVPCNPGAPVTVGIQEDYYVEVQLAAAGDVCRGASVTWDHP